jgi:hydrogenase maturation factor
VSAALEVLAYDADGTRRAKAVRLPPDPFDGTVHEAALHRAVTVYLANQRQGTAQTKTRSFVTGGNQKPWRQKGTGRARQGSTRSPLWPGGGTMFGFAREGDYVAPTMSRPGDAVLMTKGVAIEAASSLANSFREYVERRAGKRAASRARDLVLSCSTVADCLTAAETGLGPGRVTSMHDATEGGLIGGLSEMCFASGNSIVFDETKIIVTDEVRAVCGVFRIDPLRSLSEGTLLITAGPRAADEVVSRLAKKRIRAAVIGKVVKGEGLWVRGRGHGLERVEAGTDPYWGAYARGASEPKSA